MTEARCQRPDFRLRQAENGWLLMEDAFDAGPQARIWLVEPDFSNLVGLLKEALETPAARGEGPLVRVKPGALRRAKQEKGART